MLSLCAQLLSFKLLKLSDETWMCDAMLARLGDLLYGRKVDVGVVNTVEGIGDGDERPPATFLICA